MAKSLSVHKNTIEKKRKRDVANALTKEASKLIKDRDIRAYAVVGIDSQGRSHAFWDTGSILPMWAFASTIKECLQRDIEESEISETWKPDLPIKG